ncbi:uncharacterized protein LOC133832985 [Humulus lupulus]|uniref:uncharacterized protein LOC133832985 n=1 Tax=Humulus lupulus TaxID=3486 RepID=UPI002B4108CB|nr:uncharacterized protein LOC133832985 [Humulus lupulus]
MVMFWLIHSVFTNIAESIMFLDRAIDMWNDLVERFNQGNGPRIFQLKTHLLSLKQGDQYVSSYFTKLKSLWDELKEFQPSATCTCGAMKKLVEFYNQEQVLQFLTGLNESYHFVRAQILLNDLLPSISKVFSVVIQEEHQCTLGDTFPVASAVHPPIPPASQNKQQRPSCSHCMKPGHLVDKCFFLHGYPSLLWG